MNILAKIIQLRKEIDSFNLEYFLIPSNDEFQSEYVPEYLNRLKFITGFSGSNGIAVIGKDIALFFTDSRYLLQARQELEDIFDMYNINSILEYLPTGKIGYDPKLHTVEDIERYKEFSLHECENLVDLIWKRSDTPQVSKVFSYPLKYAGESSEVKCGRLKNYLKEKQIDALIITDSASICWLLNIRAHDIPYNPILLSYLIFHLDGAIELFSNANSIDSLKCYSLEQFSERLKLLDNKKVQLDPQSSSVWLSNKINKPIFAEDPCLIAKSCKNKIEIAQTKRIHIVDGVAVSRMLFWLERECRSKSELDVVDKMREFRSMHSDFIYPSFSTIAAFAENGAVIHYSPNKKTNKTLSGEGLFLIDSGGQYWGGTTDITRVIPIGKPSYQQKLDFTLVLKGHIALASSVFAKGTTGEQLDVLARYHLWRYGKDYGHGTGHGVGNCLGVHEGPQRIGKRCNVALEPGMILSNEPGYYKDGEYGIRIENLMVVNQLPNGYLSMETISLVPIERRMILTKMLSDLEVKWLNQYHQKVYKKLAPLLSYKERRWLENKTLPLVK